MTDYEKINKGYKLVKRIYSELSPKINKQIANKTSVFVYYVDQQFSKKDENLVGLIIRPEEYERLIEFVFFRGVYRAPNCKRMVGIDVEAQNPERVLKYGLERGDCGKILMKGDRLSFSKKGLLGVSLMGKGINVLGNIPLVLEEMFDKMTGTSE